MAAVATKRPEKQGFSPRNEGNYLPSPTIGTYRMLISRISGIRVVGTTGMKHLCPRSIAVCTE